MKRLILVGVIAFFGGWGCGAGTRDLWFEGGFDEAVAEAKSRQTLILLEFYTDWCSWCQRLEADTFSDPAVQEDLEGIVAMRVNAEKGGAELASRFSVDGYPTLVFVDTAGEEIDRIIGYLPPDRFVDEIRRVRAGDTFSGCLERLDAQPDDLDALHRAVRGFLQRSDPEAAISRIQDFHAMIGGQGPDDPCAPLMFEAQIALQKRVYERVERALAGGESVATAVPDSASPALAARLESGLADLDFDQLRETLRTARREDAGQVLAGVGFDRLDDEGLWLGAEFAFDSGRYDEAAQLYLRWFRREGASRSAEALNVAAWNLYLSQRELDAARSMAARAYEEKPSHSIADTLARLLYLTGERDDAARLMGEALAAADGVDAVRYRQALDLMRTGEALGDIPPFELYPAR